MTQHTNLLDSKYGRLFTFGLLYVCEGVPLGFAAVAMAAYMRRQGMDVAQVGAFVGAFYLPWAFKWAWAPLVDLITLNRFGGRKAWISLCLIAMIVTLYGVAQIDYTQYFTLLITLVIVHNVFASTCDVAIDSLAVNALREDERGLGNGFMFGGAYLGQGLGGGGAMFVAGLTNFTASFIYVSVLLLLVLLFVLFFVKDPSVAARVTQSAVNKTADVWRTFKATIAHFTRELIVGFFKSGSGPKFGVLFALLPLGAMTLSIATSQTLQVDYGLTDTEIAQINLYGTILSGIGCVVGGWIADKLGHRLMLVIYYGLTVLPTLYFAFATGGDAGIHGISYVSFFAASLIYALVYGFHYGTSAAIFMGLTNPVIAATQFTGFMALRNLTISYTSSWQGYAVDAWGYSTVFYLDSALVILPILVIPFLKQRKVTETAPSAGAPLPESS